MVERIERIFPRLRGTGWRVTSPSDPDYNCIAWAAGDTKSWWWPISLNRPIDWPAGVAREATVAAFEAAFGTLGYARCVGEEPERGVEKVALFVDSNDCPTHAARQLPSGLWTSKLGMGEDVEHALRALEGDAYGAVAVILGRSRSETGQVAHRPDTNPRNAT